MKKHSSNPTPDRKGQGTVKERLVAMISSLLDKNSDEQREDITMPPAASRDTAFRLSGILTAVILLLAILFSAILGMRLYGMLGMGSYMYRNRPAVYLQSGERLKFTAPYMEAPATVANNLGLGTTHTGLDGTVTISPDGKTLLYMQDVADGTGSLYLRDLAWEFMGLSPREDEGTQISTGVKTGSASFVLDGKVVIYLRGTGGDSYQLCRWDKRRGEQVLDDQCTQLLYANEDGNICYRSGKQELRHLVVEKLYNSDASILVVENSLISTYSVEENGSVVYLAKGKTGGAGRYTAKRWDGKELLELAHEVDSIVDVGPKGEIFYLRNTTQHIDPFSFFIDDLSQQDSLMSQPKEEDFMEERRTLWGTTWVTLDEKAYKEAQKKYEEKLNRDAVRETIREQRKSRRTYTLMHAVGNSQTTVDTGLLGVENADASAAAAVYYKERSTISEKFKISSVLDSADALRMLEMVESNGLREYYYLQLGDESAIFQTASPTEVVVATVDGDQGLYYIKGQSDAQPMAAQRGIAKDGGTLYYAAVEGDGLGAARKLDTNVTVIDRRRLDGQMLYLRANGDDRFDLFAAKGGRSSQLAGGIAGIWGFAIHGESVAFMRDYHTVRESGSLCLYNGRLRELASDAHSYSYRTADYIYLLADYDETVSSGTLYLYTGNSKRLTPIDSNVNWLMP